MTTDTRPKVRPANRRGAARLAAVQALYQMEITGGDLDDIIAEFESFRLGSEIDGEQYREADALFFRQIVSGVVRDQRTLDPAIDAALTVGWPLPRIDALLRAILRGGAFELAERRDIPPPVVISEYIDVARAFYEGDVPPMVNAVLDTLARRLRPAVSGDDG